VYLSFFVFSWRAVKGLCAQRGLLANIALHFLSRFRIFKDAFSSRAVKILYAQRGWLANVARHFLSLFRVFKDALSSEFILFIKIHYDSSSSILSLFLRQCIFARLRWYAPCFDNLARGRTGPSLRIGGSPLRHEYFLPDNLLK
jgi:hypothetical protein